MLLVVLDHPGLQVRLVYQVLQVIKDQRAFRVRWDLQVFKVGLVTKDL